MSKNPINVSLDFQTRFNLTPEDQELCEHYFILHWSGAWFHKCYSKSTFLSKDDKKFQIIFSGDERRGHPLDRDCREVAISFRYASSVNNVHGYALVERIR